MGLVSSTEGKAHVFTESLQLVLRQVLAAPYFLNPFVELYAHTDE